MKRIALLVVVAAIVMSFAVTAFASCGTCGKCNTCPKPCQPCVTCGQPCNVLQSMYDWMSGWQMPCSPCAQPCNTCAKPACSSCK